MSKEMLINVSEGEECRIALVENGRLEELYMERASAASHVGNIYKGRVTNVEPSIQAAFIDFGLGRNGFLHISDLMPTYFGRVGEDIQETVGRKMARRDRPPIQRCLRRGDEIIVQIIKEGIGTKGPTLSTYLSIPGRILVMMPGMSKLGVSRKIEDEEERRRLRVILDQLKPPGDCGFIIRTAGVGKSKAEIQKDLNYLTRLWQNIKKRDADLPPPLELYTEGDLVTRTVRDVFTPDIDRIVVDDPEVTERIKEFIKIAMPRTKNKVELYDGPVPLFHKFGIEKEIELMYARHVPLPSGGSLVIDSTEAIVAIDVNSGKFRDHADAETTAFRTDMEAADEIPRQLRLRDLGGVIICDFIDLRYERHRRELERTLQDKLHNDRAKTKMLRMSQFGIIEMTRQRMRPSLKRSIYSDCPHCKGAGLVKTAESMSLDVMRRLAIAIHDNRVQRIELAVCPDVALYLNNRKRGSIAELENRCHKPITIRPDSSLPIEGVQLDLFDSRDGLVFLAELGMAPPANPQHQQRHPQQPQRGGDHRDRHRGDKRDRDRDRRDRGEFDDDRFDIDSVEDAVDQRQEKIQREITAPAPEPMPETEPAPGLPMAVAREPVPEFPAHASAAPEQVEEEPAAASEEAVAVAADEAAEGEQPAKRKRRRGRRGGRGRGRKQAAAAPAGDAQAAQADESAPEPEAGPVEEPVATPEPEPVAEAPAAIEPEPVESEPEAEPKPKKRTRRGGRGRTKRTPPPAEAPPEAAPAVVQAPATPTRTGSTDRHLMRDEPVLPQPVLRPRTYRDLDHIPDDLD